MADFKVYTNGDLKRSPLLIPKSLYKKMANSSGALYPHRSLWSFQCFINRISFHVVSRLFSPLRFLICSFSLFFLLASYKESFLAHDLKNPRGDFFISSLFCLVFQWCPLRPLSPPAIPPALTTNPKLMRRVFKPLCEVKLAWHWALYASLAL